MTNSSTESYLGFSAPTSELDDVIRELRTVAHAARRQIHVGETLATTALVHEAYLKLTRNPQHATRDRKHFFALAACAMREILIDEARRRGTRGHSVSSLTAANEAEEQTEESAQWLVPEADPTYLLELDQLIEKLAQIQPRMAHVVTCRFFAGYTEEETAELLSVDVRTVQRDWQRARMWLNELRQN